MQANAQEGTGQALSGTLQAAQLLMVLGEENAAQILRQLKHSEIEKLGKAMTGMSQVSSHEAGSVLEHFVSQLGGDNSIRLQAGDYTRNVMISALGEEQAHGVLSKISMAADTGALEQLGELEASLVGDIIREEHPQIQAIVMSYLDPTHAGAVLAVLPEELRLDIVVRLASIETIDPKALSALNHSLRQQVDSLVSRQTTVTEGVKSVANILNTIGGDLEQQLMEKVIERDEDLARRIQEVMYVFEDLLKIPDRDFQKVLREVSTDRLSLAMKGAEETLRDKVFKNMSTRAAEIFAEDMENLGPVKVSDVEEAQKEIMEIIKRLGDSGDINLSQDSGDMVA